MAIHQKKLYTRLNSSWQTQFWMAVNIFFQNYVECQELIKNLFTVMTNFCPCQNGYCGKTTHEYGKSHRSNEIRYENCSSDILELLLCTHTNVYVLNLVRKF